MIIILSLFLRYDLISVDFKLPEYRPETKQELLDAFREFHIGEWKHKYVDSDVLDGTQWELVIEYSNGRKTAKYYGGNAFPFNFDEFAEFMGDIHYTDDAEIKPEWFVNAEQLNY